MPMPSSFWPFAYGRQEDGTFKNDSRSKLFSNSRNRCRRRCATTCARWPMMAKLESVHNSRSKFGRSCALHRALHRGVDFDGFRSDILKIKQIRASWDAAHRRREPDSAASTVARRKWSGEMAICSYFWKRAAAASAEVP